MTSYMPDFPYQHFFLYLLSLAFYVLYLHI